MVALPVSLRTFAVYACLDRGYSTNIDAWIHLAIRNGVTNLHVYLGCGCKRPDDNKYIFPWQTLQEPPTQLKRLDLQTCVFGCNLTSVWTSLECLRFWDTVLTQNDMDRILNCFPNLQEINLFYCKVPAKLTFGGGSLSGLKVLFCLGVKQIEVLDARALREFSFKGINVGIKLTNAHQLSHLYGRMSSFIQLEELKLYSHPSCGFSLQTMAEVLKGCPVLRRLEMVPPCTGNAEYYTESPVLYPHKSLEFIKLSGFCGSCFNVKLAKFLLQVAEALLNVVVQKKVEVSAYMYLEHSGSWHSEHESEVIKDVLLNSMKSGHLTFL